MRTENAARSDRAFGWQTLTRDLVFLAVCFVFLYLHLFLLPNTPIYYEMDHVALLNDAKRMTEGDVIYKDFFEFTFPGSHLLYFGFLSIFGAKYWIANLLILLHGLASAVLCLAISRRLIGESFYSYLPAAIYIFFGFRWFGIDGEHRMFSPIFACVAVLIILAKRSYGRIALAGFACALSSFFTQQRGILAVAAIGMYLFIEIALVGREWIRFIKSAIILGLSFFASLFLMLLPFIMAAGANVFYESTVLFLSNYVQDPDTNSLQSYLGTLAKLRTLGLWMMSVAIFYHLLIPVIYFVALAFLWAKRKSLDTKQQSGVLLVCLMGIFLAIGTFAPNAHRMFQIAVPAVLVLGWLVYRIGNRWEFPAKIGVIGLMIFGLVLGIRLQTGWEAAILHAKSGKLAFLSPVLIERYTWLSEHASPGDYVYETYNSHVNFPLHLRNPSRISVLLNTGYTPQSQLTQAIDDLKTTNARYIIWDGAWTDEMASLEENEKLKRFYLFLTSNYVLRQKFSPYDGRQREIWERIGDR